jgi:peptidoglycan/LPS O-acetylase OafA/YrhL
VSSSHEGEATVEPGRTVEQAGERRSARVESLRALAALGVLAGHIASASAGVEALDSPPGTDTISALDEFLIGGGLGVFLFFTLTGYLLFWPFARSYFGDSPRIDLVTYARNRALRILPLYFAVVVVFFVVSGAGVGQPGFLRYLTMTQYLDTDAVYGMIALAPLWSVVVEIQYYALLPLIAWGLSLLSARSLKRAALILLAVGLVSLWIRHEKVVGIGERPPAFWRFNMPANFLFFVPGMLLALIRLHLERGGDLRIPQALREPTLWVAASVAIALLPVFVGFRWTPVICISSFLLVGACVLPLRPAAVVRAFDWRPLAAIGVVSYSLYVWHVPVLEVLRDIGVSFDPMFGLAVVAIPAAIAVAFASYYAVETPFLRLRRSWSRDTAAKQEPETGAAATPAR